MTAPVQKGATSVVNVDPYLRMHWHFTDDKQLFTELARSMNEVAIVTNMRTIGTFPLGLPAITGEQWFVSGSNRQQQTLREVFTFTAAGNITHNINTTTIGGFTRIYGTFTDGTNWYPLPYVDVTAANNQVNVIVTPTVITIAAGGGSPPTITSGYVVLEWLSQP